MKRIKRLSTASTTISIISIVMYIAIALLLLPGASEAMLEFTGGSMSRIDSVDSNSPSAGFEVLIYLFGGALGFLGSLFILFMYALLGFLVLYLIPSIVSGIVANVGLKKGKNIAKCLKAYKTDGLIKIIMNGIIVVIGLLMVIGELGNESVLDIIGVFAIFWNYIFVFILSIFQLKNIKHMTLEIR